MKKVDGGGAARPKSNVEKAKPAPTNYPTKVTVDRDKFSRGGKALKLRGANRVPDRIPDPPDEVKRLAELEKKHESGKKLTKEESREMLTLLTSKAHRANLEADIAKAEAEAKKQRDDILTNIRA